jgi:hypothetical protein
MLEKSMSLPPTPTVTRVAEDDRALICAGLMPLSVGSAVVRSAMVAPEQLMSRRFAASSFKRRATRLG